MNELARLSAGKYLSLTTFRKSGEAVATPVWVVRDGAHLYVVTDANSGKVKRLRNNSEVLLAPCDVRGNLTGEEVTGTAEILGEDDTAKVRRLINSRYGLLARGIELGQKARRILTRTPAGSSVGLRITPRENEDSLR